ncbi:hypothetical protein Scep_027918 [Stephania cephalantha]|uniref:Uncharacterized protein n=1 Tax=Stephania cephalantha TaxID=152367 RepID=A0AAP0E8Y0_9MAGN
MGFGHGGRIAIPAIHRQPPTTTTTTTTHLNRDAPLSFPSRHRFSSSSPLLLPRSRPPAVEYNCGTLCFPKPRAPGFIEHPWSKQLPNCLVPLLPPGSITASTAWSIATCSGHFRTCLGHASAHDQGSYPTAGNRLDLVHPRLKGLDPRFSKGQELLGGAWPCPGTGVLAGARLSPTGLRCRTMGPRVLPWHGAQGMLEGLLCYRAHVAPRRDHLSL